MFERTFFTVTFSVVNHRNHPNFPPKKRHLEKNYIISERSEDGLSSHAFISIWNFLTKVDFFEGGGGLNNEFNKCAKMDPHGF